MYLVLYSNTLLVLMTTISLALMNRLTFPRVQGHRAGRPTD